MRRTHLALGFLLLLAAAATAVFTADRSREQARSAKSALSPTPNGRPLHRTRGPANAPLTPSLRGTPHRQGTASEPRAVIETLSVEPLDDTQPSVEAQARRVQTGARARLEELTAELRLREDQQREIFSLLARSHPDYSPQLYLVGVPMTGPFDPLGKSAADRRIHKLLDPDQQLDLEIMAASADVWWTDVIARLERDLEESTKEPSATSRVPEHDPSPPEEDPPPAPTAPAPSNPRPNNLFELLQDDRS